jgi:hypothetical protein
MTDIEHWWRNLSFSTTNTVQAAWELNRNVPIIEILNIFEAYSLSLYMNDQQKQIPWPLVRKLTIPTERPPLLGEI